MLDLIVRLPGGEISVTRLTACDVAQSTVLLRGFKGQVFAFNQPENIPQSTFWTGFGLEKFQSSFKTNAASYQGKVRKAIDAIQRHSLNKVVLSRDDFFEVNQASAEYTFKELSDRFSDCTVFAFKHAVLGDWMGASPEVLLQQKDVGYQSMSLAGTRLKSSQKASWGSKEQEEQNFVTNEIVNKLKAYGGKITISSPRTQKAGPVEHLLTWVSSDNGSLNEIEVLESLHPTPAICGTPTKKAKQMIEELEQYDREMYTGYLALMGTHLHAIVLLRSMKWHSNGIRFFAGGGITKDSVPLSEWKETEHKISALKDSIILK